MKNKVGQILLPLGSENEFFEVTSGSFTSGGLEFRLDTGAFQFLAEEFISQGVLGIAIDPYSAFAEKLDEVAPVFRRRINVPDKGRKISSQALAVVRPMADELAVDLAPMYPYIHGWIGPQLAALVNEKSPRRQTLLEDVFVLHGFCYHLLLGIKHGLQVDINLRRAWSAVHHLRAACKSQTARANLAFVQSLMSSYSVEYVGCLRALPQANSSELVDNFDEFLADELYRQISVERYRLGLPPVARKALLATRTLARRLIRKKLFARFFDYGTKAVSVGTGIPLPNSEIAGTIAQEAYLPPIVDLTEPISTARQAWAKHRLAGNDAFSVTSPILQRRRVKPPVSMSFSDGILIVTYDFFDFTESFDLTNLPELGDPLLHESFRKYFAVNLDPPSTCSAHSSTIGPEAVKVEWREHEIKFTVGACCEEAAKAGLVTMLAYSQAKDYARNE